MSFKLSEVSQGILTVRLSGKLTTSELTEFQRSTTEQVRKVGGFRVLLILENFEGFGDGKWSSTSVQSKNDDKVDRIAIVGEKKWRDLALMFTGKGLRPAQIEYFEPHDLPKASAWLAS